MAPIAVPLSRRPDRKQDRRREELAFLPAALEIVETPPSPVGRTVVWTIVAIFAAALAWASIGTVDIVAVALGKTTSPPFGSRAKEAMTRSMSGTFITGLGTTSIASAGATFLADRKK